MTITFLTTATVASVGQPFELIAHSDNTADTTVTWSASPSVGVTFRPAVSTVIRPDNNFSTTIQVDPAQAGATITVTAQGNATAAPATHKIEFAQFFPGEDAAHYPQMTLDVSRRVVLPGASNDEEHSPDYTATIRVWDATLPTPAFVAQPGVEIRWSLPSGTSADVYDVATGKKLENIYDGNGYWWATVTDSNGASTVRVTQEQIAHIAVQAVAPAARTYTVDNAYYTTLDPSNPIYQSPINPQIGPGPYTDTVVDLDAGDVFYVDIPAALTYPDSTYDWSNYEGWLEIDHAFDETKRFIAASWSTMRGVPGTRVAVNKALLDHSGARNSNILGLFVQSPAVNTYTYYPFSFSTTGTYKCEPIGGVRRQSGWVPVVTGRPFGSLVSGRNGIPVEFTGTFDPGYISAGYSMFFEWFLSSYKNRETSQQTSPQSVQLSALKLVLGSHKYTDTLPPSLAMGYSGPGSLYVDFFLARSVDDPIEMRIYSDWIRSGWVLST